MILFFHLFLEKVIEIVNTKGQVINPDNKNKNWPVKIKILSFRQ